jgi:hypothetical protein
MATRPFTQETICIGQQEVVLERHHQKAVLHYRASAPYRKQWHLFSAPFVAFLCSVLAHGISQAAQGVPSTRWGLAMGLAVPALAVIVYYNLTLHFGERQITFEPQRIAARQIPWRWFGNFHIADGMLDGFYLIERFPERRMNGMRSQSSFIGLYAVARNGRRLAILEGPKEFLSAEGLESLYGAIREQVGYPQPIRQLKEHDAH